MAVPPLVLISTISEFTIEDALFSNTVLEIILAATPPLAIISSAALPNPLLITTEMNLREQHRIQLR